MNQFIIRFQGLIKVHQKEITVYNYANLLKCRIIIYLPKLIHSKKNKSTALKQCKGNKNNIRRMFLLNIVFITFTLFANAFFES